VLEYSSAHTVEELQEFTAQWVPIPRWVKVESVVIPQEYTTKAAEALIKELGRKGVNHIGGASWWQWRKEGSKLEAEWIEMRSYYQERKKGTLQDNRVMLYVHGGAYYFGSVDVHRYQLQRHARKMKARVLAR
jgi:acetyl esterase/lipase